MCPFLPCLTRPLVALVALLVCSCGEGGGAGEGEPCTALSITPANAAFEDTEVGSSSPTIDFAIGGVNCVTGTMSISVSANDFVVVGGDCGPALAINETCTVSIRFNPVAVGEWTAALNASEYRGGATASASLSGVGL